MVSLIGAWFDVRVNRGLAAPAPIRTSRLRDARRWQIRAAIQPFSVDRAARVASTISIKRQDHAAPSQQYLQQQDET